MKVNFFRLVTLVFAFFSSVGCMGGGMSAEEIENLVNSHLKKGDGEEKIISFFESQQWPYSYDRFTKRFQARDPSEEGNKIVNQVLIYVDDSKSFLKVEVESDHAAPL